MQHFRISHQPHHSVEKVRRGSKREIVSRRKGNVSRKIVSFKFVVCLVGDDVLESEIDEAPQILKLVVEFRNFGCGHYDHVRLIIDVDLLLDPVASVL